jgi:hypothetical protein
MVLVSIVGDFYSSVLPVFYEHKDKISKHIIIHDDFKNDEVYARKIINGTCSFIEMHNLNIKSFVIKLDEDSYKAMYQVADMLRRHISSGDELLINVTDGLANIGIVLSNIFMPEGAKILTYDRYDNEYNILTSQNMQTYKLKTSIPIKDHLQLKDIKILQMQDTNFADKYENDINILFEKYEADRQLYVNSAESENALKTIATGFLYEYYIYNLIKKLNYDDILLGVKIEDNRTDYITLVNEYDILVMKENHLHMIECKYLKVLDTTALLYKLDSVKESLDEDANILIATNFDNYNETQNISNKDITPLYKRAFAKRIHLRGSPCKDTSIFMKEVDTLFLLNTQDLNVLKREEYKSLKVPQRKKMQEEILKYLCNMLGKKIDFSDKEELLRLLQYKTYKKATPQIKNIMSNKLFYDFIKLIIKMQTSKQEYVSIYDVYDYYEKNLKTK